MTPFRHGGGMTSSLFPALLVSLGLLLLPIAFLAEQADQEMWTNRLFLASLLPEPDRHTPLVIEGTFLPPVITKSTHITSAQSPLILTGRTRVPRAVTLEIDPGVTIYAHEFAELIVAGRLVSRGQPDTPIVWRSNEAHPLNQIWNGLIFTAGSQAEVSHTIIQHAAPAMSCLPDSQVSMAHVRLNSPSLGLFSDSRTCLITDSQIQSQGEGVVSLTAPGADTIISAKREPWQLLQLQ